MNIQYILKERFGHTSFRSGQEEVIRHILARKDTVAIFPTGMGKSLCYQLPAYLMEGLVLIISPLVALMDDQVAVMRKNGEKRVAALTSFLAFEERQRIIQDLQAYKFLFVSPEMLQQQKVLHSLQRVQIAYVVIDEAHCISQWGFDFRPDYLRIGELLHQLERPSIVALTATADKKTTDDIIRYLHMTNPVIVRQSLDRSNLSYAIVKVEGQEQKAQWIEERLRHTTGPGIIYVSSRKRADELAARLEQQSFSVASYHAGMEREDRVIIHEQYRNGDIQWICATNAFGMGIHKNDIRQIIHEQLPSNISAYVQEVGRAGRDGLYAATTLLYDEADIDKTRFIVQEELPDEAAIRHYSTLLNEHYTLEEAAMLAGMSEGSIRITNYYLERMSLEGVIEQIRFITHSKERQLQKMVRLLETPDCLRAQLLSFFDERKEKSRSNCCSNCHVLNDELVALNDEIHIPRKWDNWDKRLSNLLG